MAREFKDSGIEWIGQIPREWNAIRLKYLCTIQTGNKDTQDATPDGIYPFYVRSPKVEKSETYSFDGEGILMAGDGVGAGRVFHHVFGKYAVHQRVYRLANITGINSSFLFYYISNLFGKEMDRGSAQSTVPSVRLPMLQNFIISAPSFSEQQKIADYLDKVCGEVDEMVALQETMIEELKAYKQSVITEAVTKGLDPNVPMRNSGIDWIGDIPEHWGIQRLKTLGWTQNGISQSGDYFGEDYEYPFISYSDAYKNYSLPYPSGRANSSEEDRQKYSLTEGDVLFTRTSETIEEIGFASTCIETIPNVVYSGFLIRFRPTSENLFKGFSKYYFRSQVHRAYFVKQMNIVTRASLGQDLLKNLVVLLPPLDEQRAIASYLDTKCSEIDSLIALKQAKIDELKEYKKSVIYEYVTGKKEVC